MILGVLLAHKRYPLAKYLCILMIVSGVAMFMYKDSKSGSFAFGTGEALLVSLRSSNNRLKKIFIFL